MKAKAQTYGALQLIINAYENISGSRATSKIL